MSDDFYLHRPVTVRKRASGHAGRAAAKPTTLTEEDAESLPGCTRVVGAGRWVLDHPVDLAFGGATLAWLAFLLQVTDGFFFAADDLRLIEQSGSWRGLIDPYNGHLSVIILGLYRAIAETGGLVYRPYAVAGVVCLVTVPIAYFVTTRRTFGAALAALAAMPLLWSTVALRPANLNHHLVLIGAILCAAALNRGPRADVLLGVGLVLSLSAAGGGVVVAIACFLHNGLARAPRRRWLVVLVPSALWAAWWWLLADADTVTTRLALSRGDAATVLRELSFSPFENATLGATSLAIVLLAAFVTVGVVQVRRGLPHGANFLAWSAAVVLWGAAVIHTRGVFAEAQTARYTYLVLGFALLAIVPCHPINLSDRHPALASRSGRWGSAAVIILLAGLRATYVRGDLEAVAATQERNALDARGTMLVVEMAPGSVPGDTPIEFFGYFDRGTADDLRALIVRYGPEHSLADGTVEAQLIDLQILQAAPGRRRRAACDARVQSLRVKPGRVRLWSEAGYTVDVRRYGEEWARLAYGSAGRVLHLTLPALHSADPWEVRADGACLLDP